MLKVAFSTGLPDNEATRTYVKNAFRSFFRGNAAFSNGKGSEDHADYINGTNLSEPPISTETILTGGAYVESVDNWKISIIREVKCYAIKTLDGNKPPPDLSTFDPFVQSATIFFATISRRENLIEEDGKQFYTEHRKVTPFGQLGGRNCPMFLMGDGPVNYMPIQYVQILPVGHLIPSPYTF
jgi:hypothetical protein